MTRDELIEIMPYSINRIDQYIEPLNECMATYEINTPLRQAAFIAQIAHESAQLRYVEEIASGAAYEGRKDLGNTEPGDGRKFKGRGLIQITGRSNYKACGDALGVDLISDPEALESPDNACSSAAWFWDSKRLNESADIGDILRITKKINGGTNGFEERLAYYEKAKLILIR